MQPGPAAAVGAAAGSTWPIAGCTPPAASFASPGASISHLVPFSPLFLTASSPVCGTWRFPWLPVFLASGSASGHCSLSICSLFLSLAEPLVWLSPGLQGLPHLFLAEEDLSPSHCCQPLSAHHPHLEPPSLSQPPQVSSHESHEPHESLGGLSLAAGWSPFSSFTFLVSGGFFLGGCSFLVSCCPCTGLGVDFLAGRSLGGDFLAGVPFTLLPCPSLGGDFFAGSFSGSPSPPQSGASMSMLGILVLPLFKALPFPKATTLVFLFEKGSLMPGV